MSMTRFMYATDLNKVVYKIIKEERGFNMSLPEEKITEVKPAAVSNSKKSNLVIIKGNKGEKQVDINYLNEKLAYFYNNGGPIMDI